MLAQLPAPNAAGVSAGHDIMIVKDLDGANKFWNALGAEPGQLGTLKLIKLPGVLYLMRKGDNKGGTEDSSVEYVGYKVKNLKETLAKMDAAGFKPMPGATNAGVPPHPGCDQGSPGRRPFDRDTGGFRHDPDGRSERQGSSGVVREMVRSQDD